MSVYNGYCALEKNKYNELITLALIRSAVCLVMTFSIAAGMKMSHCSYIRLSSGPVYGWAFGKPTIVLFACKITGY